MTYIEKLFEAISFISKRHTEANWVNIPKYDFSASLTFAHHHKRMNKDDGEYIIFYMKGDGSIELRLDLNSLAHDLHLPELNIPKAFYGEDFECEQTCVIFDIPKEWSKKYQNKKYIQDSNDTFILSWRCSEEQFQQRVNNFNNTMTRIHNCYK